MFDAVLSTTDLWSNAAADDDDNSTFPPQLPPDSLVLEELEASCANAFKNFESCINESNSLNVSTGLLKSGFCSQAIILKEATTRNIPLPTRMVS